MQLYLLMSVYINLDLKIGNQSEFQLANDNSFNFDDFSPEDAWKLANGK